MTNMPACDAIHADGLTVRRGGRTVLPGLSFTVPRGQITGLLGPSGCGKSTLLRAVVGTQANVGGTLTVLGLPAGHRDLRNKVAYVTQAPSVYTDLTVRQNVEYYATVLGCDDPVGSTQLVLADVDLSGRSDARAADLSGGQRGRVSLAVALLGAPELLVLDEPTVGLDPVLRRELWAVFQGLTERGVTLLISSHVMDEAERCDDLLLMRDGHLLAHETPQTLRSVTKAATVEDAFLSLVAGSRFSRGATR